ncbi:MAG: hypothetical protein ABSC42_13640 [Tepidisphaeraceae bacterium]
MPEAKNTIDNALLEMRWRCLSLAADLDRLDRAQAAKSDPGLLKLHEALRVLLDARANRAERVQMIFSDQTPPPPYGKAGKR